VRGKVALMFSLLSAQVSDQAILHPPDYNSKVPRFVEYLLGDELQRYATTQLVLALFELAFRHKTIVNLLRNGAPSKPLREKIAD